MQLQLAQAMLTWTAAAFSLWWSPAVVVVQGQSTAGTDSVGKTNVTSLAHCGPAEVREQQHRYNASSLVLLGGLFPLRAFKGHGQASCAGPVKKKGFQRAQAMVLAMEMVNCNRSLLPGVTLAFDIRDTCSSSVTALQESLHFVPDFCSTGNDCFGQVRAPGVTISGVVGAAASDNSITTQNLLRLFEIPQVSYGSTASELSDKEKYKYFFRVIPPDTYQSVAMADLVDHFNWSYVVAVSSSDTYGQNGISGFVDSFTKRNSTNGSNCIAEQFTLSDDPSPAEVQRVVEALSKPWTSNSSVLVFFGQSSQANTILSALGNSTSRRQQWRQHTIWVASDSAATNIHTENRPQAQGMLGIQPSFRPSSEFDTWFGNLSLTNTAGSPWLLGYWESLFNCTNGTTCNPQQTFADDPTYSQESKVTFTMEAVFAFANALHNMQAGLCGGGPGMCAAMLESSSSSGGRYRVRGSLLRQYLQNVTLLFPHGSSELLFDSSQDRTSGYTVYNLHSSNNDSSSSGRYLYQEVGQWKRDNSSFSIHEDKAGEIDFGPGATAVPQSVCSLPCLPGQRRQIVARQPLLCCWECQDCGVGAVSDGTLCRSCPETHKPVAARSACQPLAPTYLQWSDAWAVAFVIVSIAGLCCTVAAGVFYLAFHKKQAIVAGNRVMSAVILAGILLCYALPFVYIGRPHVATCALRRLAICTCLSLCFGALLVKISRIYRVVNRVTQGKSLRKPKFIDTKSQLVFVGGLVCVPLAAAIVWLIVEPPSVTVNILARWERVETRCGATPRIGLSLPLSYNLLLLIACVYFTVRTRNVPKEYNEARFIHLTVLTSAIVWLTFIAFYYSTAQLEETFSIIATISATQLTATLLLIFLIAHKIYSVVKKQKGEEFYTDNNPTSALRRSANNTIDLAQSKQSFESREVLESSIREDCLRTQEGHRRDKPGSAEDESSTVSISGLRDCRSSNNNNAVTSTVNHHTRDRSSVVTSTADHMDCIQRKDTAPVDSKSHGEKRKMTTSSLKVSSREEINRIKSTIITPIVATADTDNHGNPSVSEDIPGQN